jgi:dTDP-4-amino-4,6-dideoxygalactose transaminase
MPIVEDYARHAWHLYPILLDTNLLDIDRDEFIELLKTYNVGTSVLFIPLHCHSLYQSVLPYREGDFPVAESIFRRIVNLPVSPAASTETVSRVAKIVAGLIGAHS